MPTVVLRRLLPLRVIVSLGISFAVIGIIVVAGAVLRDRHPAHRTPTTSAPRSSPSPSSRTRVGGAR